MYTVDCALVLGELGYRRNWDVEWIDFFDDFSLVGDNTVHLRHVGAADVFVE